MLILVRPRTYQYCIAWLKQLVLLLNLFCVLILFQNAGSRLSSRKNNTCSYDVPSCRTQYRQTSFFPRTLPDWNGLPQEVVTAESLDCFKLAPVTPPESPPPPIPLPMLTNDYNNDPNLCNLLSSNRIINKMILAALWWRRRRTLVLEKKNWWQPTVSQKSETSSSTIITTTTHKKDSKPQ